MTSILYIYIYDIVYIYTYIYIYIYASGQTNPLMVQILQVRSHFGSRFLGSGFALVRGLACTLPLLRVAGTMGPQ